jgi:prepilin-type N-terminal cleavage/methylation domain-containing protein
MVRPVFKNVRGFTLIEVIVVLAVAGVVAVLALKSLGGGGKDQSLVSAQREFLTALRGAQNRVLNGVSSTGFEAVTINSGSYVINGSTVSLSSGVTIANSSLPLSVCFASSLLPNSPGYTAGKCGNHSNCTGAFFGCDNNGNKTTAGSLTVIFSNGSTQKSVVIEGSGMTINRVYAQ